MKLYDSHTHLNTDPLFEDRRSFMRSFIAAGGRGLVNSWANESYNLHGIQIAQAAKSEFPGCIVTTTLGRHPESCGEWLLSLQDIPQKMQEIKNLYLNNSSSVVAIGECGIDLHYPDASSTLDIQKALFLAHCDLARELDLPLVIHSRDAFTETFEILKNYPDLTMYFHCRGYGPDEYKILNDEFWMLNSKLFIGFCGNVTYKNAEALRETLKIVSLTQLLLETDAPYLSPQVVRWTTNHPANVKYIYAFVSEFLNISVESFAQQVETNFHSLYRLWMY